MSGIYINGFPLPNNCGACPLRLAWCRERIYMVTRPERCPLVPVPDHGRMGDLDALEKELRSRLEKEGDEWMASEIKMAQRAMRVADYKIIKSAPTIIPADHEEEEMK